MDKEKNTPALRFRGFDGPWKKKKIKDIGVIMTGTTPPPSHTEYYSDNGIPWVTPTDIDGVIVGDTARKLSPAGEKAGRVAPAGTILVTCIASLGKNALLTELGGFNQQINSLTPTGNFDSDFLLYDSFLWSAQMKRNAAAATMQIVNKTEFSELPTMIPSLTEQKRIGSFLRNVENLLELQQQKIKKAEQFRQAMLEKLFPAERADEPALRFRGFSGPWEKYKLGDIATRVTRKNSNLESTLPLTISAADGMVDQITYFNNRVASGNVRNYFLIKKGEFAYNKSYSDGYPFGAVKRLDRYDMGVLSVLYILFAPREELVSSDFLVAYYETSNWYKEVAARAAEGARNHGLLNISPNDFFDTELSIPATKKEQQKIGDFFRQLDSYISLQKEKLEKLRRLKAALLEKLFV